MDKAQTQTNNRPRTIFTSSWPKPDHRGLDGTMHRLARFHGREATEGASVICPLCQALCIYRKPQASPRNVHDPGPRDHY
jgi:hypothetical protein